MFISILKSKIHCANVTEANLHYMGSITIDQDLMDASGILPGEHVHVVNNNNGERIETYAIAGPRKSGCICLNGARLVCSKWVTRLSLWLMLKCRPKRH